MSLGLAAGMKRKRIIIRMISGGTPSSAQPADSALVGSVVIAHGGTNQTANDAFDQIGDSTETGYVDRADFGLAAITDRNFTGPSTPLAKDGHEGYGWERGKLGISTTGRELQAERLLHIPSWRIR